jgi:hypothetical protein
MNTSKSRSKPSKTLEACHWRALSPVTIRPRSYLLNAQPIEVNEGNSSKKVINLLSLQNLRAMPRLPSLSYRRR